MRIVIILFLLISDTLTFAQKFQLAPPRISYASVFFSDVMKVELSFAQDNTQIHFTTNGNDPTDQDQQYSEPIAITDKITTIKTRVYSTEYFPSDVTSATFVKSGFAIREMRVSAPNSKYSGSGSNTLFDQKGGIPDHTSKTWLGYDQKSITCELKLSAYQWADTVVLNVLENTGAWIFAPTEVEVFAVDRKTQKLKSVTTQSFEPTVRDATGCRLLIIPFEKIQTTTLVISIRAIEPIPEWHPGHGKQGWLFIDEINVY